MAPLRVNLGGLNDFDLWSLCHEVRHEEVGWRINEFSCARCEEDHLNDARLSVEATCLLSIPSSSSSTDGRDRSTTFSESNSNETSVTEKSNSQERERNQAWQELLNIAVDIFNEPAICCRFCCDKGLGECDCTRCRYCKERSFECCCDLCIDCDRLRESGVCQHCYNAALRTYSWKFQESSHTSGRSKEWVRPRYIEVDTPAMIRHMLSQLARLPKSTEPHIAFDLEGDMLGRCGVTCYMQLHDTYHGKTYLIDLLVLGQEAFSTSTRNGYTLKECMEDSTITKLIFDCRQDSDALFAHYGVKLAGVLDLQYMCMLTQKCCPGYRIGMKKVMGWARLSSQELREFESAKGYPFKGNYAAFRQRPCPEALKAYAANDVAYLERIYASLKETLTKKGLELAFEWSQKEVEASWKESFCSSGAMIRAGFGTCWDERLVRKRREHPT